MSRDSADIALRFFGIGAIQCRRASDLLYTGRIEALADLFDFAAPILLAVGGEFDLHEFMIEQGTVDFCQYGLAQSGRAGLHDRLEMMGLFLECAAGCGIEV